MKKPTITKGKFYLIIFLICLFNSTPITYSQLILNQFSITALNQNMITSGSEYNPIRGRLDTLWTDSTTFRALKNGVVFRFYAFNSDSITLHGWENDTDLFKDEPTIKLNMGGKSGVQFGTGSYFGNLVFRRDEIRRIKRIIKDRFKYVLFIPHDPNDPMQETGQITYDIAVSNDDPSKSKLIPLTVTFTKLSLNPSPPRNPG